MHVDIVDLRTYYASPEGLRAARLIGDALAAIWQPMPQERLLGFGYTVPWLKRFRPGTERTLCFMPAGQGAVQWPSREACSTALVFEEDLPLPDAAVDRILLVHALEHAQAAHDTLSEFWRVLAPNGRLIIVVPNRRGVWARFEHTPFGTGRPYSRGQVRKLLRDANFTVETTIEALHAPPFKRAFAQRFDSLIGVLGRSFWPMFGGVLIVSARKQVYQGLPATARRSRRVFAPVLAPQGARAARTDESPTRTA